MCDLAKYIADSKAGSENRRALMLTRDLLLAVRRVRLVGVGTAAARGPVAPGNERRQVEPDHAAQRVAEGVRHVHDSPGDHALAELERDTDRGDGGGREKPSAAPGSRGWAGIRRGPEQEGRGNVQRHLPAGGLPVSEEKLTQASRYIAQAKQANPDHPKLAEVAFYRKLAPRED